MRFTDEIRPPTVKLMARRHAFGEIRSDPMLHRYDTLHHRRGPERSLNIDFILGYVARLLPARPDLVFITSATIDSDRFAFRHVGGHARLGPRLIEPAPVIGYPERTYPVEIRLSPSTRRRLRRTSGPHCAGGKEAHPDPQITGLSVRPHAAGPGDPDDELATRATAWARHRRGEPVDELSAEGDGDILVFLPGERTTSATTSSRRTGAGRRQGRPAPGHRICAVRAADGEPSSIACWSRRAADLQAGVACQRCQSFVCWVFVFMAKQC